MKNPPYHKDTTHMVCRDCGETKHIDLMKKSGNKVGFKCQNICKKCNSIRSLNSIYEKKLALFPNLYVQCDNDDCMLICKKKIGITSCPKCGSKFCEV